MRPIARGLKKVFLVHGEPAPGAVLAKVIEQEFGVEAVQPARGETSICSRATCQLAAGCQPASEPASPAGPL